MRDFPSQTGPGGEPVSDPSSFTSSNANDVIQEEQNAIESSGQTLVPLANPADNTQLSQAMARYASGGLFGVDSGAVNAYVISSTGAFVPPSAYFDGMAISFFAGNGNTGASTFNAFGIGVKKILDEDDADLTGFEFDSGSRVDLLYSTAADGGSGAGVLRKAAEKRLLATIVDEKTSGSTGGTFTSGSWFTRTLNTIKGDDIGVSLSTSLVTLPAGDYEVFGRAPAFSVNQHKAKLYNATDAVDIIVGSSAYATAGNLGYSDSIISGSFTLATAKDVAIQHQCTITRASDGLGVPSSFGISEIYASLEIWKVE